MRHLGASANSRLVSGSIWIIVLVLLFSWFTPMVAFFLALLGSLAVLGLRIAARHRRARSSRSWPLVDAHLEGGSVIQTGDRHPAYLLEITYSYTVDGEVFSGEYRQEFRTKDEPESLLRNFEQFGIRVRIDPQCPSHSGFEPYRDI